VVASQSTSTSLDQTPGVISIQKQAIDITGSGSSGGGNKVLIGMAGSLFARLVDSCAFAVYPP
jgi:hypothetical protein